MNKIENRGHIYHMDSPRTETTNNSATTNNIYLRPVSNHSEYEKWLQQIGSLLHVADVTTEIKPLLDMLIAFFEPERMFLINRPAIKQHNIMECIEIILIIDAKIHDLAKLRSFIKIACIKLKHVVIAVHSNAKIEIALNNGHPYYSSRCKEENLIFSGSRYRLPEASKNAISNLVNEVSDNFIIGIDRAKIFLAIAKELGSKKLFNQTAIIMHQCLETVYKTVINSIGRQFPSTHKLGKLRQKAEYYMPQMVSSENELDDIDHEMLDMAYETIAELYFHIDEIYDVSVGIVEIEKLIQSLSVMFESDWKQGNEMAVVESQN